VQFALRAGVLGAVRVEEAVTSDHLTTVTFDCMQLSIRQNWILQSLVIILLKSRNVHRNGIQYNVLAVTPAAGDPNQPTFQRPIPSLKSPLIFTT